MRSSTSSLVSTRECMKEGYGEWHLISGVDERVNERSAWGVAPHLWCRRQNVREEGMGSGISSLVSTRECMRGAYGEWHRECMRGGYGEWHLIFGVDERVYKRRVCGVEPHLWCRRQNV